MERGGRVKREEGGYGSKAKINRGRRGIINQGVRLI